MCRFLVGHIEFFGTSILGCAFVVGLRGNFIVEINSINILWNDVKFHCTLN